MKYFQLLPPHSSWTKPRAFTLIELSITLALIAMIAAISLPVVLNFNRLLVSSQAKVLQITCWAIQQQAIALNKETNLTFNEISNSYGVPSESVIKLSPKVKFGILPEVLGPPASPTKHLDAAITFANKKITFYPNGRISPGSIYLIDENRQALYAITVPVSSVLYIRRYRYQRPYWLPCT